MEMTQLSVTVTNKGLCCCSLFTLEALKVSGREEVNEDEGVRGL